MHNSSTVLRELMGYIRTMTPERGLDQLEPLTVDALQKIDRLIEGQGKLSDTVTRADQNAANATQKADYADYSAKMADTTAKGVANQSVSIQKRFDELRTGQETIMNYLREKLP